MKALKNQLTPQEEARLAELEAIIIPGIVDCLKIGDALREISEKRLYRKHHTTFAEYVKDTYAIGVRTAYELVEHSEIVEQVKNYCPKFAQSSNPNQTRALKNVPAEKRAKVIEVASADGPPTAKKLREAAKAISPSPVAPAGADDGTESQEDQAGKAMPSPAVIGGRNLAPSPFSKPFDEFKHIIESACADVPQSEDLTRYILVLSVEARKLQNLQRERQPQKTVNYSAYTR